ncbi:MAG: GNAT family N-acetyltransferase [Alphaproteobacteria bacterium]|nr:MAG: GNAT family N-acetyltransferase [Alphaproteobacteria bacterium]
MGRFRCFKSRIIDDTQNALRPKTGLNRIHHQQSAVLAGELARFIVEFARHAHTRIAFAHDGFHQHHFKEDLAFIGIFENGILVGSMRLSRYDGINEAHKAYIAGLFVDPAHRGKGYGRTLVKEAITLAKSDPSLRRLNLNVVSGQAAARTLYRSTGFTECGVEFEAFEYDGSFYDEILMTLALREDNPLGDLMLLAPPGGCGPATSSGTGAPAIQIPRKGR